MTEQQKRKIAQTVGLVVVIGGLYLTWNAYSAKQIANAAWPTLDGGVYATAVTRDGVTSLVPNDEIYSSGVVEGGIPALTHPTYESVAASDAVIADSLYGIDLELNGEHRFYPVQILNWHEVVNDSWGGKDIVVTYCPLCGTGVVYENRATMSDAALSFSATGQVYNNNSLLKDDVTGSLWLQSLGVAVQGESIGQSLVVIPSTMMTWENWKTQYPDGLVLSTDTGFVRDYTRHPYGNYDTSKGLYFPMNHTSSDFTSKWIVYGVSTTEHDEEMGLAFSSIVLQGTGLNSAVLGATPVIAVYDFDTDAVRVFTAKNANGDVMTFSYDFAKKRLTDNETQSVWNAEGRAVSGSLKGTQLEEHLTTRGFWSCLAAMHPTWKAVTAAEGITTEPTEDAPTDNASQEESGETVTLPTE